MLRIIALGLSVAVVISFVLMMPNTKTEQPATAGWVLY